MFANGTYINPLFEWTCLLSIFIHFLLATVISSPIIIAMNKIVNQRYSSYGEIPPKKHSISPEGSKDRARQSHATTMLLRKEAQIDVVKKRISALCVREQRYNNRTMNTDV